MLILLNYALLQYRKIHIRNLIEQKSISTTYFWGESIINIDY